MSYYNSTETKNQFLLFLTLLFVVACYIVGTQEIGVWVLIFVTGVFLVTSNFKFEAYAFHIFILQFILYSYATSMWAYNYHQAIAKGNTILQILICLSIMYSHFKQFNDVTKLVRILMWSGYIVVIFAYFFYGVDRVVDVGSDEGRLGNSFNNINTLSMLAATVVVINVFFLMFRKANWSILLLIPAVIFVISSQSRKSVAIILLGLILLSFLKYLRKRKTNLIPFAKFFGFVLLLVIVLLALSSTSMLEGFTHRMMGMINWITGEGEVDASTLERVDLRELGWEQFSKTPYFGIGMGCTTHLTVEGIGKKSYLHDNYAELAACGGLFGLISYYSMYIYLLLKERKYLKVDDMAILVFTLLLIRLIVDYGSVSYFSKINYFQLMIYFLHLESCRIKYPDIEAKKKKKKKSKWHIHS